MHRALVSGHGWGDDGLSPQDVAGLEDTAKHISETERRSMLAERDTTDRYLAAYLSERVGGEFTGRISGIARFGMFVKLDDSGADGLVPLSTLGNEYFNFNADNQTLTGERSKLTLGLGQRVVVRLTEAIPTTGGLALELLEVEGRKLPRTSARKGEKSGRRKPMTSAKHKSKIKKKVKRSRR